MMPLSIGAYGNAGTFNGVALPNLQAPNFASPDSLDATDVDTTLQNNQNLANQQNQALYQQALQQQANGYNNQQQSIQQAMQADAGYGQAQISQLGLQLQNNLGNNTQSNTSRGLNNTTLALTSQAPIMNNYNQAVAGVNNQAANLQAGLASNLASSQIAGGNALANTIASRTDQAPNAATFATLNQQANSNPGQIQGYQFQAPTSQQSSPYQGSTPYGSIQQQPQNIQSSSDQFGTLGGIPTFGENSTTDFLTSDSGGGQAATGGNGYGGGTATIYGQGQQMPASQVPGVTMNPSSAQLQQGYMGGQPTQPQSINQAMSPFGF